MNAAQKSTKNNDVMWNDSKEYISTNAVISENSNN